ncbi:salivary glue protein Sgs-3 [Drosophila busckii]|uniref:salivary glue protein Sgs-3 n=1 Tax=Drosophila busckii TaxID=30019 RepID=UPI001432D44E|nr:salivary glue protein Sgs-3 [Drosophila busckii]
MKLAVACVIASLLLLDVTTGSWCPCVTTPRCHPPTTPTTTTPTTTTCTTTTPTTTTCTTTTPTTTTPTTTTRTTTTTTDCPTTPTTTRTTRTPSTTTRTKTPSTTTRTKTPSTTTRKTPSTTTRKTVPPTTPRPWYPCDVCGPGGKTCEGCPTQDHLCRELLNQMENLKNRIRICVCGANKYLKNWPRASVTVLTFSDLHNANMKFAIVTIIASYLLLNCLASCSWKPPTTTTTPKPWVCQPCGPGGNKCDGCPTQQDLCRELVQTIFNIEKRVRSCVCGQRSWQL